MNQIPMENLTKIHFGQIPEDSPYVTPYRLYYAQNGVEKSWDLIKVPDGISVVLFNSTRKVLLFVKQFRPAVYFTAISAAGIQTVNTVDLEIFPAKLGITLELCAGMVDKNKPLLEIAQEEILEEVGYNVSIDRIEKVMTYRSDVGAESALQTMFYCEVTDDDKVNTGGGVDDEIIEVVECSIDEATQMLKSGKIIDSPPNFLFGILWFLENKAEKFTNNN